METLIERYAIAWTILLVIVTGIAIYTLFRKRKERQSAFITLLKSIHSPNSTQASWMRWASSFVLVATFVLAYYQQKSTGSVQEALVLGLVGLALTGKVAQKVVESKNKLDK